MSATFYDLRLIVVLLSRMMLMRFSARYRLRMETYQAAQDLTPAHMRDCTLCFGMKCMGCGYGGNWRSQLKEQQARLHVSKLMEDARSIRGAFTKGILDPKSDYNKLLKDFKKLGIFE